MLAAMLWLLFAASHAEQLSIREYGQDDGLGNLAVRAAAQDAEGFLWLGTENGLYRFDGMRFDRVGRERGIGEVNALHVDVEGRLWIGLPDGLWVLEHDVLREVRRDEKSIPVSLPLTVASRGADRVWVVSDGRLIELATGDGGQTWHGSEVSGSPAGEPLPVASVAAYGDELWLGCGRALCRLREGRVERWGSERGVPEDRWFWLLRDNRGGLWARGVGRVLQLKAGSSRFIDRTDAQMRPDPAGAPFPLAEDAQGRILTSAPDGLFRWDGQQWKRFGADSSLPSGGKLRTLVISRDGGLWMGMAGGGLLQWRGYGLWQNWAAADGLAGPVVWSLARDAQGRLHVGTGDGLSTLDEARGRFMPSAVAPAAHEDVSSLVADDTGRVWLASISGRVLGLPQVAGARDGVAGLPMIYRMRRDRQGTLWMATAHGVHRWTPGEGEPRRVDTGSPPPQPLFADLCEDRDGVLWFAGESGLFRSTGDALTRQPTWRPDGSEESNRLTKVACLRDGSLVIAGPGIGLRQLNAAGQRTVGTDITPPSLRDRFVLAMLQDRRGWLWVSADNGVAVWNGHFWRLLDQRQGLIWNDTSENALYEDRDGSVWIGTSRGASRVLDPQALFAPVTLPDVRVLAAAREGAAMQLQLAAPLCCDSPSRTLEYRLAGVDGHWTRTSHPDVRLAGLAPGRYRFEARVADIERARQSPAAVLEFEIEPPWWATRVFYAASALLVLGVAMLGYRWRVRSLLLRRQELERLVGERTRELEASREQLRELATRDALTGAWNRRAVVEIGERELMRSRREGRALTLVLADIDHFKRINDTHGHPAGDEVLREFVRRLVGEMRPYDAVGRYGGEEFVLLLPGSGPDRPDAARLAAIHACVAALPFVLPDGQAIAVTCSFGVARTEPGSETSLDALVAQADAALYRAKQAGRNRLDHARPLPVA